MQIDEFYVDLMNTARARAEIDNDYVASAFFLETAERLEDAEEVDHLLPAHFEGVGERGRRLAVDGYDLSDADGSVALAVMHYVPDARPRKPSTLTQTEARRSFGALSAFLSEAMTGRFEEEREESSAEFQLARDLRTRGRNVTRYRFYLLTNAAMSARAKAIESAELNGVRVDYHIWDATRFHQLFLSTAGREELEIDLTEWNDRGIGALRATGTSKDVETYLLALPGTMLADLYGRFGSRLLESNVRSYLSARGAVNKGIRSTLITEPESFLAYNNGITATATGVMLDPSETRILSIRDLQIVNGGQTTASLFYVQREGKAARELGEAFVQAKLVVVDPEVAADMVPRISRYANSQNRVSEADFFSNSPFHVRLEGISRRLLAPPRPGISFQVKWFYERTRGQYLNEQGKLSPAEAKRFASTFPRDRVITKTDAARYESAWAQRPHIVSSGAQKNFVAFAGDVAGRWESSPDEFNEVYFKSLVAKALLYQGVRRAVAKSAWYESGYLANIVAYAMAKLAHSIQVQAPGRALNFDGIWQAQGVSPELEAVGVEVAHVCFKVLTDPQRPVINVTEWAKREACWEAVKKVHWMLPAELSADLVSTERVIESKRNARATQRIDSGIEAQGRVVRIGPTGWAVVRDFVTARNLATPLERDLLVVACSGRRVPSEKQSVLLLRLLDKASSEGLTGVDAF